MSTEVTQVSGDDDMQAAAAPMNDAMNSNQEQERHVPLSALESERSKRQQLEEENRMMRDHVSLMQAQQVNSAPKKDDYAGMDDTDVMTVGEFKKLTSNMSNQFQMTLEELKMSQKYPDYQEVITKYLPEVIKTNPNLRNSLQKTQDYELAYYLAKNSDSFKSENKRTKKHEDAEKIMKNAQNMGSLSSLGASTPVAQAKSYKHMSDQEFRDVMARNLGY